MINCSKFPSPPVDWATSELYSSGSQPNSPTKIVPTAGMLSDGHEPDVLNVGPQHLNYQQQALARTAIRQRDAMLLPKGQVFTAAADDFKSTYDRGSSGPAWFKATTGYAKTLLVDPYRCFQVAHTYANSVWTRTIRAFLTDCATSSISATASTTNVSAHQRSCVDRVLKDLYHIDEAGQNVPIIRANFPNPSDLNVTTIGTWSGSGWRNGQIIAANNGTLIRVYVSGVSPNPITIEVYANTYASMSPVTQTLTGSDNTIWFECPDQPVYLDYVPATFGWVGGWVLITSGGATYTSTDNGTTWVKQSNHSFGLFTSGANFRASSLLNSAVVVGKTIVAGQVALRDSSALGTPLALDYGGGCYYGYTHISDDWGNTWRTYWTGYPIVADGGNSIHYQMPYDLVDGSTGAIKRDITPSTGAYQISSFCTSDRLSDSVFAPQYSQNIPTL